MQKDLKKKLMLNRCEVRVDSKMDSAHEKLRLPTALLVQYLLDTKEFDEGFDITGMACYLLTRCIDIWWLSSLITVCD